MSVPMEAVGMALPCSPAGLLHIFHMHQFECCSFVALYIRLNRSKEKQMQSRFKDVCCSAAPIALPLFFLLWCSTMSSSAMSSGGCCRWVGRVCWWVGQVCWWVGQVLQMGGVGKVSVIGGLS